MSSAPRIDARAVFAGCARDCAEFLPRVLKNLEMLAALFLEVAFIFVENDSHDSTRVLLEEFCAAHPQASLIKLDGLAEKEPLRTARLAAARNAYLQQIADGPLWERDYLAVFDMDDVNSYDVSSEAFAAAVDFLAQDPARAAAFACSDPVYFDIWALRHPEWCAGDAWAEVRSSALGYSEAAEKFIYARQKFVSPEESPISVSSAFGGMGIYRLAAVLPGWYTGVDAWGGEVCEHVGFHETVSRSGGLYIFPPLRNHARPRHLRPRK